MITIYICETKDCPNSGMDHRVEDAAPVVTCGGCYGVMVSKGEAK